MLHLSLLHYQNFGIPHPDCQRMPSSHHPVQCLRHEVGYPDSENRAGQFSVSLAGEKLCNPWFQSLELTPKPENPLKHQETSHMLTFHNSEQWPKPHQESLLRDQCGWKRVSPSAAVKPRCVGILRLTQTPLTSFSSHVSIAFGFLARNFRFSEICPFHFWLQTLKTNTSNPVPFSKRALCPSHLELPISLGKATWTYQLWTLNCLSQSKKTFEPKQRFLCWISIGVFPTLCLTLQSSLQGSLHVFLQ